jgi:hypothetical protein
MAGPFSISVRDRVGRVNAAVDLQQHKVAQVSRCINILRLQTLVFLSRLRSVALRKRWTATTLPSARITGRGAGSGAGLSLDCVMAGAFC